jgi:hypothetical protein
MGVASRDAAKQRLDGIHRVLAAMVFQKLGLHDGCAFN